MNVIFQIGNPPSQYVIFQGSQEECQAFFDALPSTQDEEWEDAWNGTNPFQEACFVDEEEPVNY